MYSTCTAIVTMVYRDTLTRGVGERVVVRVQYLYCHSYYGVQGYSDKGGRGDSGSIYMYSTCTAIVTMVYRDTLTRG